MILTSIINFCLRKKYLEMTLTNAKFLEIWKLQKFIIPENSYLIFHFFTKEKPLINYEKSFLFHLKSSFRSQDIQLFLFLSSRLFSMSVIVLEDNRK